MAEGYAGTYADSVNRWRKYAEGMNSAAPAKKKAPAKQIVAYDKSKSKRPKK